VGRRAVQHAGQRRVAAAQLRHAAAQRRHGEAFRPGVQAFAVASQVCRRTSKAQPVTDTGVCICSATYVRTASKGTTRGDRDHEGAKTASLGAAKASYLSCSRKQTRPHDLTHLLQSCCSPKVFHTRCGRAPAGWRHSSPSRALATGTASSALGASVWMRLTSSASGCRHLRGRHIVP
jgi:hypothetical protein